MGGVIRLVQSVHEKDDPVAVQPLRSGEELICELPTGVPGNAGAQALSLRPFQLEELVQPATPLVMREDGSTATDCLHCDALPLQRALQKLPPATALDLFVRPVDQPDERHPRVLSQHPPVVQQQIFQFLKLLR